MGSSNTLSVLVTGANAGLGLGICKRLIDEFLHTRPDESTLLLIPTCRTKRKADETVRALRQHVSLAAAEHAQARRHLGQYDNSRIEEEIQARVLIEPQLVDLCDLKSIKCAVEHLLGDGSVLPDGRLDVVIANAGIGGWSGIDWWIFTKQIFLEPWNLVSKPWYKKGTVGALVEMRSQNISRMERGESASSDHGGVEKKKNNKREDEEPLGEVFCANVFGHFMLAHWLAPALRRTVSTQIEGERGRKGRFIWLSSLEAYAEALDIKRNGDLQGLKSPVAYESSKRLTDVLVLNADTPETEAQVNTLWGTESRQDRPKQYIAQPGMCATSIIPVPAFAIPLIPLLFTLVRMLGSVWHTTTTYTGATSMVWLALADQTTLDKIERDEGAAKWGSAAGRWGQERSLKTQVEGYGFGGREGEKGPRMGRIGVPGVREADVVEFRKEGVIAWEEMERLRGVWEGRLEGL